MNHKITGLIISAGLSSRMGELKPLLEYKGKKFVERIIDNILPVCSKIVIVTGNKSDRIIDFISSAYASNNSIEMIYNHEYEKGMFSSLKKGIADLKDHGWILYHFVDQPNLPEEFYNQFIEQIEDGYDWIQPTFKGRKGHPLLFSNNVVHKIIDAADNANLRLISNDAKIKKKYWECEFNSIFTDIDTQKDLNNLIRDDK